MSDDLRVFLRKALGGEIACDEIAVRLATLDDAEASKHKREVKVLTANVARLVRERLSTRHAVVDFGAGRRINF